MNIPAIKGIIRRRLLLNYRVSPEVIQPHLPDNFRTKLVKGHAIAGICLIRLEQVRPTFLPPQFLTPRRIPSESFKLASIRARSPKN